MTCKVNRGGERGAEGQILQVVKGLPVFLHPAPVYPGEKDMTCKVNRGGERGAEGQILQVVKGLPVFYILLRYIREKKI